MFIKRLALVPVIFIMAIALFSCGPVEEPETSEPTATITVALRTGERSNWQEIASDFETQNPDIDLKFIEIASEFEQYRLILAAVSTGECAFDILEIEDVWVDDLADKEYIVPLSDSLTPNGAYIPIVKNCFMRDGKTYAVPFQMELGMLFALKEYGWDGDFSTILRTKDKIGGETAAVDNSENGEIISSLMELISYNDNDVEKALSMYKEIYNSGNNSRLNVEAFKRCEIPIMRAWSSVLPSLRNGYSEVAGKFQAYNMPIGKNNRETSTAKVFGFAVSALSGEKEKCERFIKYCSEREVQLRWIKNSGTYPVRADLYDDSTLTGEWGHLKPMAERVNKIQTRPYSIDYVKNSSELQEHVFEYMRGERTVSEAAAELREFLNLE